jgi:hypothetical protein
LYVLDINAATTAATSQGDEEDAALLGSLRNRRLAVEPEQTQFSAMCDRWDNLYYPQAFTAGGADHWADHFSARDGSGMAHVSVNSYPPYVDIPAALTAYPPIENCIPTNQTDQNREIATLVERVYAAWKDQTNYEVLCHRACTVKNLYGRTAAKIFWNSEGKHPDIEIIDQPRNLYLGWSNSRYDRLDWACYSYLVTTETALEDWGVCVEEGIDKNGKSYPYVTYPALVVLDNVTGVGPYDPWPLSSINPSTELRIEVSDYWYRKPKTDTYEHGKPVKFDTWNAIFVGNKMVKNTKHREYRGKLPFVPLFNSYIPGLPTGKSNFHDIEPLLREKDERISENAQMIHRAIAGQMWQLTGPEAPPTVPAGLKPEPNQIIAPGGGNRVESLAPWMPEFQIEQYLGRIDRELIDVSGLNDLMRGMAPTQVMSSGKAVAALVSNYETRISMPRDMYYDWRRTIWDLVQTVWVEKAPELKQMLEGTTKLLIESPSLTPRDDAEASQIALNLVQGKLWSSKRGMDRTGVDDPEAEEDIIREEQTDSTLNPAAVQVMVSLMATMQQLQQQMGPQMQQQAGEAEGSMEQNMAMMRGQGTPTGTESMSGPGEAPSTPPEQMPGNTPEGAAADAAGEEGLAGGTGNAPPPQGGPGGPPTGGPSQLLNQYQVKGGQATTRIIGQQQIQKTGR